MQETGKDLRPILGYLLEKRGFDFSGYHPAMLERRIGQRLAATSCKDFSAIFPSCNRMPMNWTACWMSSPSMSAGSSRTR